MGHLAPQGGKLYAMSKHKRGGDDKKVGKAGSPPSGTKNERPREDKKKEEHLPKIGKKKRGGGLH